MITEAFRRKVRRLRDEGWTWPEVAELTGRSLRTVQRAAQPREPAREPARCAVRDCQEPVISRVAKYCQAHGKERMGSNRGKGEHQEAVLKLVRKRGLVTSADVRDMLGLDTSAAGQVLSRLVKLGLLERPVYGHYRLPVDDRDE